MSTPFVNIHTHTPVTATGQIGLFNAGWQEAHGQNEHLGPISIGIHPWQLGQIDAEAAMSQLEFRLTHPNVWAIGETGLDRKIEIPLPEQQKVLEAHIQLAEQWQKPLIIHCVKAFPELIAVKKSLNSTIPWIIHGFNNKWAVAEQLIPHGFYFSFGSALLQSNLPAGEVLQKLPPGRFFLETDDAAVSIEDIYLRAAALRQMPVAELKSTLYFLFSQLFHAPND